MFNNEPNTITSCTLQMHYYRTLPINCWTWTTACQTTGRCSSWLTSITITSLTRIFPLKLYFIYHPFCCINKVNRNLFGNILTFFPSSGASTVCLMVYSTLIFIYIIFKLIKRIFFKSIFSSSSYRSHMLIIILSSLIFID